MKKVYILSAKRIINGNGNLETCNHIENLIAKDNISEKNFTIDSLKDGWDTPLKKNHFRSGCALVEALNKSYELISNGFNGLIIISGKDNLKTGYDREKRHQLMNIYGKEDLLPNAYNKLAETFIKINNLSHDEFIKFSEALFENYIKTVKKNFYYVKPEQKWFNFLTEYFRGVDCANPLVDFSGKVLLSNMDLAQKYSFNSDTIIELAGTGIDEICDGTKNIPVIAQFHHIENVCQKVIKTSKIDFVKYFLKGEALLEVYTCYPVLPIAFLIHSGIVKTYANIPDFLKKYEITVTGGMNLGYAPWNNPSLNALIVIFNKMKNSKKKFGIIHGNGGLGYKQGVAILKKN